jgi:hypothetical protein
MNVNEKPALLDITTCGLIDVFVCSLESTCQLSREDGTLCIEECIGMYL